MQEQPTPPSILPLAEQILQRSLGGAVRLGMPQAPEGGSQRSRLLRCQALASFEFYTEIGSLWNEDQIWGTSTTRQRAIARMELLAEATAEFGILEALGATAAKLARQLEALWPEVEPMSIYPAFR